MELAASKGLPVVVMEPLRGGRLAANLPKPAQDAFRAVDPQMTPAEWSLRWLWNQPEVTVVLSGMNDMAQLTENARIAGEMEPNTLSEKHATAVAAAVAALNETIKVPCTACGYCMPCPFGVDIPTCFSSYNMIFADGYGRAQSRYMQNINALGAEPNFAGKCKECGKCEKHCPQAIAIRKELKSVSKRLEPWYFMAAMGLYRWIFRRKKK
ncbi:hypothetical protein FACS18949_11460 [Clostridia bacterium]|nr:hypothetical protein FACS18949_11460 [Clostridia bacterium]